MRAIETAVICLTECDGACGDKSPILKHDADDLDWKGWDDYEGDRNEEIPIFLCQPLDERYYGDLQGLNKQKTAEKIGEEIVRKWRRFFNVRPPGGESLADTAARTIPFFKSRIFSHLQDGENVLLSAHRNSLRSIIMKLDNLSEKEVRGLELETGIPIVYKFDKQGKIDDKIILYKEDIN